MSSLSNLPYRSILKYWHTRLKGNKHRTRFLITKVLEIFAFHSSASNNVKSASLIEFPPPVQNSVSENPIVTIVIPSYTANDTDFVNIKCLLASIERQTV